MSEFCPQAIIFDMDGLLVDSEPVWAIAEDAMMQARGIQVIPEIQNELVGLRMREFLSGMCKAYSMSDDLDDLCTEITARMIELIPKKVVPRPGAPEL
ncbi:MAG TPA: HAD hydrolase-like protein, partial [Phototrophicaceae bacterium]|nr:HAD hydrolase-like protein [Phototrophicaceae bacterium]